MTEYLAPYRIIRVERNKPGQIINPKLEKKKKRRDRCIKLYRKTGNAEYYLEAKILSKEIKKTVKRMLKN